MNTLFTVLRHKAAKLKKWFAADEFAAKLWQAVFNDDMHTVRQLAQQGANLNIIFQSNDPNSPLDWAVRCGSEEMVRTLVECGANINLSGEGDVTPLISAVWNGRLNIVKYLLEQGAVVNVKDAEGDTALSCARKKQDRAIEVLLLEYGARI